MEFGCHFWAGAPKCYLELLDKNGNKNEYAGVSPSLASFVEHLAHCWNVASLSLFYRYYFDKCSFKLA